MGRGRITAEPPDPAEVRARFRVRQDGQIIRASTGEGATFVGPGGRVMCRVYHQGQIKRLLASRVAWVLGGANEWPHGVVRHRDGDEHNFAASNLIETKRGPHPFDQSKGGKRSSLHERQASDAALLRTLAEHPGALTVPQLSQSLGQSAPCCCTRLAKLERRGLVCGPHCNARRRWNLTTQGEALAASANPVVLDDRDRQVLAALALTSMGTVKLARRVEVCPMTIRRRVRLLVERGLVFADPRKFFSITDAGLAALGDAAPQRPEPWVKVEAVSAARAKDVAERQGQSVDDRTSWARSQQGSRARLKALSTANGQQPFIDVLTEFDRLRA
jgi:DNA-binding IclR family transcriptional regulator